MSFRGICMRCNILKLHPIIQSFPHESRWECYRKLASRQWLVLFTLAYFFSYAYSPLLLDNKKLLWSLFSSVNQTSEHCSMIYILRDYSSMRIGFNMISKCHTLPIVYTLQAYDKFQPLLFYEELIVVIMFKY